jgi:hypothetical protein
MFKNKKNVLYAFAENSSLLKKKKAKPSSKGR